MHLIGQSQSNFRPKFVSFSQNSAPQPALGEPAIKASFAADSVQFGSKTVKPTLEKTASGTPLVYPGNSSGRYRSAAADYREAHTLLNAGLLEQTDDSAKLFIRGEITKLQAEVSRYNQKRYKFPGAEYDYASERLDGYAKERLNGKIQECYRALSGEYPSWTSAESKVLSPARAHRVSLLRQMVSDQASSECYIHNVLAVPDRATGRAMDLPYVGGPASDEKLLELSRSIDEKNEFLAENPDEFRLLSRYRKEWEAKLEKAEQELTSLFNQYQADDLAEGVVPAPKTPPPPQEKV